MDNSFKDMGNIYEDILEEGWGRNLAMGAAALGLGAGGLKMASNNNDTQSPVTIEYPGKPAFHDMGPSKYQIDGRIDKLVESGKVVNLIKAYYQEHGKQCEASIQGDSVFVNGKSMNKQKFKFAINNAHTEGSNKGLMGYIANHL